MAKDTANAAEIIERRLPVATKIRVFRILVVTSLVPFEGDHCWGTLRRDLAA
jgi:hypothetical protein